MSRIGINGFGRIGRMVLRAAIEKKACVAAINEPYADLKYLAYLVKHDSNHGHVKTEVSIQDQYLLVDKMIIKCYSEPDPEKIPWRENYIDYVVEATGKFTTVPKAQKHLKGGVKKVIVTSISPDIEMFVYGANQGKYKAGMQLVSTASCTTNCATPLIKLINDKFGICEGLMTTVHAIDPSQKVLDGINKTTWRDARGCKQNIIPAQTDDADAIMKIIPALRKKIAGMSFRVPVPNVSIVDFTCRLRETADLDCIKKTIRCAGEDKLKGVLGYTENDVVSSDFMSDRHAGIFDAKASMALNGNFVKLILWYDNEYGYSCRVMDFINYIKKEDKFA